MGENKLNVVSFGDLVVQLAVAEDYGRFDDVLARQLSVEDFVLGIGATKDAAVEIRRKPAHIEDSTQLGLIAAADNQPEGVMRGRPQIREALGCGTRHYPCTH